LFYGISLCKQLLGKRACFWYENCCNSIDYSKWKDMKWKGILGVVLVSMMVFGCSSTSKVVEANSRLDALVENKTIKIAINAAEPMVTTALAQIANSGMMAPGNTVGKIDVKGQGYFIEIQGDTVSADMPYFGERQMGGGYGDDAGIRFKEQIADIEITKDDSKQRYQMRFSISDVTETYLINMEVFPNMNSDVRVSSSHRNRIRYTGKVEEDLE
jgi:uncharacterized protein YcfL